MKQLFSFRQFLLAGLLLSGTDLLAQEERPFTLSGQLSAFREGKVYLMVFDRGHGRREDSCTLVDGKFSFKGVLHNPIPEAILSMPVPATEAELAANPFAGRSNRMMLLPAGNTNAAGNSLEDLSFSGNTTINEYAKLETARYPFDETMKTIGNYYREVADGPGFPGKEDTLLQIQEQGKLNWEKREAVELDFCRRNPNSLISMALLRSKAEQQEPTHIGELEQCIAVLSPELKNSPDMQQCLTRLKTLRNLAIGKSIVDFSMPDTLNNFVSPASYRGKYVLVEFWASWCGPCRMEIPHLRETYAAFSHKGFEILGVSMDDNKEKWLKALAEEKMPWKQVSDLKGWKSDVVKMYSIQAIPLNFLVDPDGVIVASNLRGEQLAEKLKELIK